MVRPRSHALSSRGPAMSCCHVMTTAALRLLNRTYARSSEFENPVNFLPAIRGVPSAFFVWMKTAGA